jgi:hypothetical protein
MWEWITSNAAVMQAIIALVTAGVWITYLHVFVESLRRQRRSEILITMGGGRGLGSRVLVSNLGLEPIYILDVMLTLCSDAGERIVSVADRTELDPSRDDDGPGRATLQGPLKSGDYVETGTVDTLLDRAARTLGKGREDAELSRIEITIAAVTAAASGIVAARRVFDVRHRDEGTALQPRTIYAEQIRDRRGRRRIEDQLLKML